MKKTFIFCALLLAGCADQYLDLHSYGRKPLVVETETFNLQVLVPRAGLYKTLRVYIEGDGRAWITANRVSLDPTPTHSVVLELLAQDEMPSAYLARPCQYVRSQACEKRFWTDARFGQQIIDATDQALDVLKSQFNVEHFELVGYSGGAAVALLVAQQRNDIARVQTIAGNLAPHAWTSLKKLSPLKDSRDPTTTPLMLKELPQRHWVGVKDTVVPKGVYEYYRVQVEPVCSELVEVAADHWRGYQNPWLAGKDVPIRCQ